MPQRDSSSSSSRSGQRGRSGQSPRRADKTSGSNSGARKGDSRRSADQRRRDDVGRPGDGRRRGDDRRSSSGRSGRDDRRSTGGRPESSSRQKRSGSPRRSDREQLEPRTEADRRRAAVRARGGGVARDPKALEGQRREPIDGSGRRESSEIWIDEGPVRKGNTLRERASGAVARGRNTRTTTRRSDVERDPETVQDVARVVDPRRADKLAIKLDAARHALDRERYSEAKRIGRSLLKELSGLVAVHEVIGLASYRLGQWRDATASLELARHMRQRIEFLPILADCYRAQKRWTDVDDVWKDLKEESPSPDIMAEGRIVVAGSLADRGDINGAIELMRKSAAIPRRIRDYHLRQWYVLADLYDRAGDIQRAREYFSRVAAQERDFADVQGRLSAL